MRTDAVDITIEPVIGMQRLASTASPLPGWIADREGLSRAVDHALAASA
jgi:hypothetical protein